MKKEHDIAILKLNEDIDFTNTNANTVNWRKFDDDDYVGNAVVAMGWGVTSTGKPSNMM